MSGKLADKVAIITGASSGIGAATSVHFAGLGCSLVLAGRLVDNLERTKKECLQRGLKDKQVLLVVGDVTSRDYRKKLVDQAVAHFGKIDIVVNSAGILTSGQVVSTPLEHLDRMMDVNVRSLVGITQLCIPYLQKTKGTVVNVSSINGSKSFPNVSYYCMSKAAVDQFTKCLALEMASSGVRVNAVCPGVVRTEVHKRSGMDEAQYAKFLEHSTTTHALGRYGDPVEVAKAIEFLASDDSSFTTGHCLPVDGGRGIMTPR